MEKVPGSALDKDEISTFSSHSRRVHDAFGHCPALFDCHSDSGINFLFKFFLLGGICSRPGVWDDWIRAVFERQKGLNFFQRVSDSFLK